MDRGPNIFYVHAAHQLMACILSPTHLHKVLLASSLNSVFAHILIMFFLTTRRTNSPCERHVLDTFVNATTDISNNISFIRTQNTMRHLQHCAIMSHEFSINRGISWALTQDEFRTRSMRAFICHSARRSNHSATGQGHVLEIHLISL